MTKNWYKAYFAALTGACADNNMDDAHAIVKFAGTVAEISEAHLVAREKAEHDEAAAAQQKRIADATAKVLATKFYKVNVGDSEHTVEIDRVIDRRVIFKTNVPIASADLFDVADEDCGFTAAPIDPA